MEKLKIWKIIRYGVALIVVAGLSVALAFAVERQNSYRDELENIYQKSYYDTMASIGNIETKLSKLSVVEGTTLQKVLLSDIWRESELAESNLAQLSSKSESIDAIIKFLNQLGDYCYYLTTKLQEANLADAESDNLEKFSEIATELKNNLQQVQDEIMKGGSLVGNFQSELNFFTSVFSNISHSTIEYPELIYDGPFSDGLNDREAKALKDKTNISSDEGINILNNYFTGKTITATLAGEGGGNIPTYIYDLTVDGDEGTIQLTKQGGMVVMYNRYSYIDNPVYTEEECSVKGLEVLEKIGYSGMKAVWVSNNNSTVYINYAYIQNDIIVYPDLIKVKVASDTGFIIGIEAQNYLYNHTERTLTIPETINYELSSKLTIVEDNFALVPTEWNTEVMTIEYVCTKEDTTFYIYINLEKMEEERVLVVIDDNGKLLI